MDRTAIIDQVNAQLITEFGGPSRVNVNGFSDTYRCYDALIRDASKWAATRTAAIAKGGDKPATHANLMARTMLLVIDALEAAK